MNLKDHLAESLSQAVAAVFSTMLGASVVPGEVTVESGAPDAHDGVLSFIGLAGSWAGSGCVSCSPVLACRVCSQMLMTEATAVNEEVLDAVAELTNMIGLLNYPLFSILTIEGFAMETRKVLAHVRVSGLAQVDKTGVPRQEEDIAILCKEHSLQIVGEYRFDGLSGASVAKDPHYRAMLARLSEPDIAGIVFGDVDRLFRPELLSQYSIMGEFERNGKLLFCNLGVLDPRRAQDQDLIQAAGAAARTERNRLKERTRRGREIRRRQGNCVSDPLPRGVRFVPDEKQPGELATGHFEYTPESARVREAFKRILDGQAIRVVARDLGFRRNTMLREVLKSRWWVGEKACLKRRIGAGLKDDGKMFYGHRQERPEPVIVKTNLADKPLVSREDFDKVQSLFSAHHNTWSQNTSHTADFLGHGLVYCACGDKLYSKHSRRLYYICASKAKGRLQVDLEANCGEGPAAPVQKVLKRKLVVWHL